MRGLGSWFLVLCSWEFGFAFGEMAAGGPAALPLSLASLGRNADDSSALLKVPEGRDVEQGVTYGSPRRIDRGMGTKE